MKEWSVMLIEVTRKLGTQKILVNTDHISLIEPVNDIESLIHFVGTGIVKEHVTESVELLQKRIQNAI
jgi:hypothetical protein